MQGPRPRTSISRTVRFRIFQRDDFTCQYCGRRAPDVALEVDHIHPHAKGGENHHSNLTTACIDCNQGKRDSLLTAEQVIRFTPVAVPAPAPKPVRQPRVVIRQVAPRRKQVALPVYCGGGFVGRRNFDAIPISMGYVYIEADTFIGQFICAACGLLNGYEADECSCREAAVSRFGRRAAVSQVEYCECGEEIEIGEELCSYCHDQLYLYCWLCGEEEQVEGENYCIAHLAGSVSEEAR